MSELGRSAAYEAKFALHLYVSIDGSGFAMLREVEIIREVKICISTGHRVQTGKLALQDGQSLNTRKNALLHLHAHHHVRAVDVVERVVAQKVLITETLEKILSASDFWASKCITRDTITDQRGSKDYVLQEYSPIRTDLVKRWTGWSVV